MRVPFILSWPNRLRSAVCEHPVSALDLMATVTRAAGGRHRTEDSVDLVPYLREEVIGAPHEYLYWKAGPNGAIRDERWKLIRYKRVSLTEADLGADGRLSPPEGGWPLDAPEGHVVLLYDLENDAGERVNLADERPDVVARLSAAYEDWADGLASEPLLSAVRSTIADMHGETVQLIF